jgi:hypothetical protein
MIGIKHLRSALAQPRLAQPHGIKEVPAKFCLGVLVFGLMLSISPADSYAKDPIAPVIDPDHSVYGVPFGATEKQLTEELGAPSGVIQLSSTRRALIYGNKNAFIFRKGVLRGLVISQYTLDHRVSQGMEPHPVVDSMVWSLVPGIKEGMTYAQVAKLLGRPSSNGDYLLTYETETARVELQFAGRQGFRGDPDSFTLVGLAIESSP